MAVIYYIIGKLARHFLAKRNLPTATSDYIKMRGVDIESNTLRYEKSEEESEKESDNK
jgi:hypothetical protein